MSLYDRLVGRKSIRNQRIGRQGAYIIEQANIRGNYRDVIERDLMKSVICDRMCYVRFLYQWCYVDQ